VDTSDVQALYGGAYAQRYNDIWQHSDRWAAEAEHHLRSLRDLVRPEVRWLDAGCGTGWNLSNFPGVARAGIDLSPGMIEQATAANPDALFIRQGDLRDDIEEWRDGWDLVTCTGQPWSYVDTMGEIEAILTNLARWTAPDGTCFLPMGDLTDLTGHELPLLLPDDPRPDDAPVVDGVIWSLWEHDRHHRSMIWPSVGWCIDVLARHFARIEIVRWPHDPPWLPVARRVLVCTDKRADGDQRPLVVVEHPIPPTDAAPAETAPDDVTAAEPGHAGDPAAADAVDVPETAAAVDVIEPAPATAAAEAAAVDPAVLPPGRLPGGVLDQPLSYLLGRARPWTPAFWRSVRRRVRR
jgi:SAM-dependent methyltransferase